MNKKEIINELKIKSGAVRVGLPRDIDFAIEDRTLYMRVLHPTRNMQENCAAFEGWLLTIKSWLSDYIDKVELDFIIPDNIEKYGTSRAGHYNRFLYRVYNMLRLFPWFTVEESKKNIVDNFIHWVHKSECLLNHSLQERQSVIKTTHMERQIESWLVYHEGKYLLESNWEINVNKLYNQMPISIFYEKIKAKNAIFTRSASAIDLWGIGKDNVSLHIIELKCGNNISLGVISEILFYSAVVYDLCINKQPVFKFGNYNKTVTNDMIAIRNNGKPFDKLYLHLLAERYHPLFNTDLENLIGEGLSRLNISFDKKIYDYSKKIMI